MLWYIKCLRKHLNGTPNMKWLNLGFLWRDSWPNPNPIRWDANKLNQWKNACAMCICVKYIHFITLHNITYHTIPYNTIQYITYIPYHTLPYPTLHTYIHIYIYMQINMSKYIYMCTIYVRIYVRIYSKIYVEIERTRKRKK